MPESRRLRFRVRRGTSLRGRPARSRREPSRSPPAREGAGSASSSWLAKSCLGFGPGDGGIWILVVLTEALIEQRAVRSGQWKGRTHVGLVDDARPELLDQLEPLSDVELEQVAAPAKSRSNAAEQNGSAWESNPPSRCSRRASSVLKTEAGTSPARASTRVITRPFPGGKPATVDGTGAASRGSGAFRATCGCATRSRPSCGLPRRRPP